MSKNLDYKKLLSDGFAMSDAKCAEYLSGEIFQFTTYDDEIDEIFAARAAEVCEAITNGTTYEYIKDPAKYPWYIVMLNMPFFAERTEWGSSVRGAWWKYAITYQSCGLFDGDTQLYEDMAFTQDEWVKFMTAVVDFYKENIHEQ